HQSLHSALDHSTRRPRRLRYLPHLRGRRLGRSGGSTLRACVVHWCSSCPCTLSTHLSIQPIGIGKTALGTRKTRVGSTTADGDPKPLCEFGRECFASIAVKVEFQN